MTKINFSNLSGTVSMATGGHVEEVAQWGLPSPEAAPDPLALTMTVGQPVAIDAAAHFFGSQLSFALAPSSEALPDGLSLSQDGQITGAASQVSEASPLIIRASNANGYAERVFTISVTEATQFEITTAPATPFVGEVVHVDLAGSGSFVVPDMLDDIDVRWDRGFDGVYASGARNAMRVNDARHTPGREIAYVADDATPQILTATAHALGVPGPETAATTVAALEPNAHSWTLELYISYAGNFADAPVASASIIHIASHAEFMAYRANGFANMDVRLHYRAGETFEWTTNEFFQPGANLMYMTRFGAGPNPRLRANVPDKGVTQVLFRLGFKQTRVVCADVDFDDGWNPITGARPGGLTTWFIRFGTAQSFASFVRCNFNVGGKLFQVGTAGDHYLGFYDCSGEAWQDYLGLLDVATSSFRCQGCKFLIDPLATRGDGKLLHGKATVGFDLGDHGLFRLHGCANYGITNNEVAQITGWSTGYSQHYIQPAFRFNFDDSFGTLASRGSIRGNLSHGNALFSEGTTNSRSVGQDHPTNTVSGDHRMIVEGNNHTGVDMYTHFGWVSFGGATVQNNVGYWPNVDSKYAYDFPMAIVGANTTSWAYGAAAAAPILIRNNTMVSDQSAASSRAPLRSFDIEAVPDYLVGNVIEYGNVVQGGGHPNILADHGPLSPGDDFQHLATSIAHDAVTNGPAPVRDHLGHLRVLPTSEGAYQDAAASVTAVAAPINAIAPTITMHPAIAGWVNVTDQGTWNDSFDPYQTIHEWLVDGVMQSDLPQWDKPGFTGMLTCRVVATNRSGTRVEAISNAIPL